jgi:hypothetical protein
MMMMPGSWEYVKHYIAQGAINIAQGKDSGVTGDGAVVEAGSPIHRAMELFCEYMQTKVGRAQIRADLDAMDKEGK